MENEKNPNIEIDTSSLMGRVDRLRLHSLRNLENNHQFNDLVVEFDKELKARARERFGEGVWRAVPEWHKLIGSTPEEHDVQPEAKEFIQSEIERFVSELEQDWEVE